MTRVWLVTLFGAVAALSCSDSTTTALTQLNLDRPVDISFACWGQVRLKDTTDAIDSAQPAKRCSDFSPQVTPPGTPTPVPAPVAGQENVETPFWFGFILQSASGTVAISQWQSKASDTFTGGLSSQGGDVRVLDADPRTPGKNAISVGEEPIAIVTDKSGCFEITANAGSCDLSALDINSALTTDPTTNVIVNRQTVTNGLGVPLRAKPAAMVVEPNTEDVGNACAKPTGVVYVAYPGCHLVAGIDLATGKVRSGVRYNAGVPTVLTAVDAMTLTCPDECGAGAVTDDTRPATLDLEVDARGGTRRLAIGADNTAAVTVVDLEADFDVDPLKAPLQVPLESAPGSKLGVTTIVLSPQLAMGNSTTVPRRNNTINVAGDPTPAGNIPDSQADAIDASPGGEAQYIYAVATDGTVRVADVLNLKRECDTQVDMRFVRNLPPTSQTVRLLQCFPIGDPLLPRRPGAKSPGIELPVDGVPTSVAIIKGVDRPPTSTATVDQVRTVTELTRSTTMLVGYFAVISASSGQTYVVNLDDDDGPDLFNPLLPFSTAPVLTAAHQLRDSFGDRSAVVDPTDTSDTAVNSCTAVDPVLANTGAPRSSSAPVPTMPVTAMPPVKAVGLPVLLQETCTWRDTTQLVSEIQLGFTAATPPATPDKVSRDRVFPDLRAVRSETVVLSWEGNLSNDSLLTAIDGPQVRTAQMVVDPNGMRLVDHARPYCDAGVEPFDIVQFRGCNIANENENSDCPRGYTCYVHKDNQVPGLGSCMLANEASRLSVACGDFLTTAKRYTVGTAESGQLTLLPRKHVLATTPVDGCVSADAAGDQQCKLLADYAQVLRTESQPSALTDPSGPKDSHAWACRPDPARAPVNADPAHNNRCIQICNATSDCDAGTICVGGTTGAVKTGTCMESVLPPQSCVNGPQRFELHASEAFAMVGVRADNRGSGYVHPIIENAAHQCVVNPAANPLDVGRIPISPLRAPPCAADADPYTGKRPNGQLDSNPCTVTVPQWELVPKHIAAGSCAVDPADPTTLATAPRDAPAIRIRTRATTLTLVDPYSPGDAVCIQDRAAGLGKIPLLLQPPFDAAPFSFGYQLTFELKGGFAPVLVGGGAVVAAFPVKVVRGPSESIWIMDDGDYFATQIGQASTRGQVYRVESTLLSKVNLLQ